MIFSLTVLTFVIYGALVLAALGGVTLVILLLRDAHHGKVW